MKNLKEYIGEGLADWSDDKLNKKISKQTNTAVIKKEIIDYIFTNYTREPYIDKKIYKNKIKIDTSTTPWTVDYNGDLYLKTWLNDGLQLTNNLFQWGEVTGWFDISFSKIDSLEGGPNKVGKFICNNCNNLKSLEGGPTDVSQSYYCSSCKNLESLKGAPKIINWVFNCSACPKLKSLEGGPEKIYSESTNSVFICQSCNGLKDLTGAPKMVDQFDCCGCESLTSLKGAPIKVNEFYCNNCKKLESFKGGPKEVSIFSCKECDNIINFVGTPNNITILYCQKCKNLESLNGLPKDFIKKIYCSYTSITTLDGAPDKIDILDITGCDKLNEWGDNGPKKILELKISHYDKNIMNFLNRKDDPNYPIINYKI